ncbi:hypothetical protein LEMLEM_LOCUS10486 [Lemmus lemmus]
MASSLTEYQVTRPLGEEMTPSIPSSARHLCGILSSMKCS